MKITKFRDQLVKKNGFANLRPIRAKYNHRQNSELLNDSLENSGNNMKIIGITGSSGKSSVACILHECIKSQGFKSVLYSSAKVDSPASFISPKDAYELAISSESSLLSIIEESIAYDADFLILEVNESVIEKGIVDGLPFDVRVLTNLNPFHNMENYSPASYTEIKKKFFTNIDDNCKCVYGFQDYEKQLLEEFLRLNSNPKMTFGSNYVANVKGVDPKTIDFLLYDLVSSFNGLKMKVLHNNDSYSLETNLTMKYNAMNILCVMSTMYSLDILDFAKFDVAIRRIHIPGRCEILSCNERKIIIDPHLSKVLENLKEFKEIKEVNNIRVVIGSTGHGYMNWDKKFCDEKYIASRRVARMNAMSYLAPIADYVYLTEADCGAESVLDICTELQRYLGDKVESEIILDRRLAIAKAIRDSLPGDVIFISGRGNRRVMCDSATTMKLVKDAEVVEQVITDLEWLDE